MLPDIILYANLASSAGLDFLCSLIYFCVPESVKLSLL